MNSNVKCIIPLLLLVSSAAPVAAEPAPVSDLNAQSTSSSTTSNNQSVTPTQRTSESSIEKLERLLKSGNRVQLAMQQQLDEIATELSELRGNVERNSYDLSQMLERQRDLYRELEAVRSQPKAAQTVSENSGTDSPSDQGSYATSTSENEEYQAAVNLILKDKNYTGAISAFETFLTSHPESVFTPNANYWLGQLFFAQKNDVEAAKNFAKVIAFADSNKRADALLKLGDLAGRNNNKEAAKKYYQLAIDGYPKSTTASQATTNLNKL
ncbi:MAG: tol-pal system protein YbgF [Aliivibrio sp.]|uniref:tol-pal system protein YbgF n=1 Tax=Aliivibrio sp. TaxID=1872443 RepID=UPI001A4B4F8B|nr:tol-pal system protein YbgF [Aliivibrio sp.]